MPKRKSRSKPGIAGTVDQRVKEELLRRLKTGVSYNTVFGVSAPKPPKER